MNNDFGQYLLPIVLHSLNQGVNISKFKNKDRGQELECANVV